VISKGNLVSYVRVDGGMSGLIRAEGDIGVIQRTAAGNAVVGTDAARSLTRFGGILINNTMTGQVISLGNAFGDMRFNGGLGGWIAVKGRQVAGLDPLRYGILGNLTVNGEIGSSAGIVSGGVIGDDGVYTGVDSDVPGTHLTIGSLLGRLAAEGDINYAKAKPTSGVIENATGSDKATIDALFVLLGSVLTADLNLILGDLGH
jgi:hypothetical protein